MTGPLLPSGSTRGVLSGQARLVLPTPSDVIAAPAEPPALGVERADYANPVRLELPPGWRVGRLGHLDVVFLIDDSGSMYGPAGDPRAMRRAAALSVVDLLARAI